MNTSFLKSLKYMPLLAIGAIAPVVNAQNVNPSKSNKASSSEMTKEKTDTAASDSSKLTPMYFETWTFYFDAVDRTTTSIYFDPGSAMLTSMEKMRLRDWVNNLKQDNQGRVSAIVASWSDKPYPMANNSVLTKSDRDLAESRNQNVKEALRESGVTSIETFSMAERPNWFQRTFATDSAQIKGEAKDKQWDENNESRIASILNRRGGPSRSVILFRPVGNTAVTGR